METLLKPIVLGAGAIVLGASAAAAARTVAHKVTYIEHARGVHPALRALLTEWNRVGTHTVVVAPGATDWPYPGGVRTDADGQAAAAAAGLSRATTLRSTPHGRAAALDVWPEGFNPRRGFDVQPSMEPLFRIFGEWAERQRVLVGDREFLFRWLGKAGDLPHVELIGWEALPFPPPNYGEGFA